VGSTLSRPYLPGTNANDLLAISSRSSRLIAALGIAEVTLRRASPVAAVSCESPALQCSDRSQNVSRLGSDVAESLRAIHDVIGAAALCGIRRICGHSLMRVLAGERQTVPRRC
jgi:hypothetical protein